MPILGAQSSRFKKVAPWKSSLWKKGKHCQSDGVCPDCGTPLEPIKIDEEGLTTALKTVYAEMNKFLNNPEVQEWEFAFPSIFMASMAIKTKEVGNAAEMVTLAAKLLQDHRDRAEPIFIEALTVLADMQVQLDKWPAATVLIAYAKDLARELLDESKANSMIALGTQVQNELIRGSRKKARQLSRQLRSEMRNLEQQHDFKRSCMAIEYLVDL